MWVAPLDLTEASMSRYTPVTSKAEMGSEYGHVFDQVMGVFGRVRGPFSMLLHSPELTERLLPVVPFAREICVVDPKLRQIAVLTARCASATPTTSGPRRSTLPVAWACANR
jgi:hypothetical protein